MRWPWVMRVRYDAAQMQADNEQRRADDARQKQWAAERRLESAEYKIAEYKRAVERITWPLSEPVVCPHCRSVNLRNMRTGGGKSMWECSDCKWYTHFYDATGTVKVVQSGRRR